MNRTIKLICMSEAIKKYKYESDARQVNFRLSQEYCDKLIAQNLLPPEFDRKILSKVVKELIEKQLDGVELLKPEEMPEVGTEISEIKQSILSLHKLIEGKASAQAAA